MNCTRCDFPIEAGSRFCRNCGLPISSMQPQSERGNIEQANPRGMEGDQTVPPSSWQAQQSTPVQANYPPTPYSYQPTVAVSPNQSSRPNAGAMNNSPALPKRRTNRLVQVLLVVLAVLLVLALLLVGGWFFLLRPYLHGVAQSKVDGVFTSTTNLINPVALAVIASSNQPVVITEDAANNLIALNSSQSDPVQPGHLSITTDGIRMEFQTFGFTSTITAVPKVVNGQIVMTDVTVQGPLSIIMSSDELTSEANADLQQVSTAAQRPIKSLVLKNQEVDITLS